MEKEKSLTNDGQGEIADFKHVDFAEVVACLIRTKGDARVAFTLATGRLEFTAGAIVKHCALPVPIDGFSSEFTRQDQVRFMKEAWTAISKAVDDWDNIESNQSDFMGAWEAAEESLELARKQQSDCPLEGFVLGHMMFRALKAAYDARALNKRTNCITPS